MPASIAKNEVNSAKRECDLIVYADGGLTLAPRGTDFIALGILYVGATARPHYALGTGTCTNKRRPLSVSDDVIESVNTGTEEVTCTAHVFETGDGPIRILTTGTQPGGLSLATDYWLIKSGANTIKFATSLANAYAGTAVNLTSSGSGTNTIDATGVGTQRGLDGFFTYQFPQAETNYDGSEMSVLIEGSGYSRANAGGTYTSIQFGATVQGFEAVSEGSNTYGDIMRLLTGVLAGKVSNFTTGTLNFKSLDGSKTRLTVTTDATGRLTITVGDLT